MKFRDMLFYPPSRPRKGTSRKIRRKFNRIAALISIDSGVTMAKVARDVGDHWERLILEGDDRSEMTPEDVESSKSFALAFRRIRGKA